MWYSHLTDLEIPGTKHFVPKGYNFELANLVNFGQTVNLKNEGSCLQCVQYLRLIKQVLVSIITVPCPESEVTH